MAWNGELQLSVLCTLLTLPFEREKVWVLFERWKGKGNTAWKVKKRRVEYYLKGEREKGVLSERWKREGSSTVGKVKKRRVWKVKERREFCLKESRILFEMEKGNHGDWLSLELHPLAFTEFQAVRLWKLLSRERVGSSIHVLCPGGSGGRLARREFTELFDIHVPPPPQCIVIDSQR